MAEFKDSMQSKHWVLSPSTLSTRRTRAHAAATASRAGHATLSLSDESRLRSYHTRRILRFIQATHLPDKVAGTAIAYFQRFFVDRSTMDYNPTAIALCSVYAACKVEETLLSAEEVVSRWDVVTHGVPAGTDIAETPLSRDGCCERVRADTLLSVELAFLQELRFHLICYHPFRSLGILREVLHAKGVCGDGLAEVMARAHYIVCRRALLSDVGLSYAPAVVAVAAVVVAADDADGVGVAEVMEAIGAGGVDVGEGVRGAVEEAVRAMRALPDREDEGEVREVARIEAKRRACGAGDNFVTRCLSEQERERDLRGVDEEEAMRSRIAREKTASVLAVGNGDAAAETPRKRQKV